MKQIVVTIVYGFFVLVSAQSHAKGLDLVEGKNAFETCRGCHSTPNYSSVYPTYYVPKIGGQRHAYTVSSIVAYKHGLRSSKSMLANAISLSDHTVENIAGHIEASLENPSKAPFSGDPVKGKQLAQACLGCHTNDLKDGMTAPILAGQYGNYLVKVMKDYQLGKRKDPVMQSMLTDFSEEDLENISSYFADMKGLSIVK